MSEQKNNNKVILEVRYNDKLQSTFMNDFRIGGCKWNDVDNGNYMKLHINRKDLVNELVRTSNGTLVELPCKVGDTIFVPYIYKGVSDIMRLSIVEIKISQYSIAFVTDFETDDDIFAIKFSDGRFLYGTYNDIWFTDEIKAKAELQRLKRGCV